LLAKLRGEKCAGLGKEGGRERAGDKEAGSAKESAREWGK